mmetsp:Transcript_7306/g.21583  ORF Transcript_7306/g.21583 Transcript_7306/m.21583 type:complete len:390 (-) Transcript_7306:107-1276(-)
MAGKLCAYTFQAIILAFVLTGFAFSYRTVTTCELVNSSIDSVVGPFPGTPSFGFGLYSFYNVTSSSCQEYPDDFDRDTKFHVSVWSATLALVFSAVAAVAILSQFVFPCCVSGNKCCGRLKKCGMNMHFTCTSILQALTFLFLTNDAVCGRAGGGWRGGAGGCTIGEDGQYLYVAMGAHFIAGIVSCFAPLPDEPLFRYSCKKCCQRSAKQEKDAKDSPGEEGDEEKQQSESDEEDPGVAVQERTDDPEEEEDEFSDEEDPAAAVETCRGFAGDEDQSEMDDERDGQDGRETKDDSVENSGKWEEPEETESREMEDHDENKNVEALPPAARALPATDDEAQEEESAPSESRVDEPANKISPPKQREAVIDSFQYQERDALCGGILNCCQ